MAQSVLPHGKATFFPKGLVQRKVILPVYLGGKVHLVFIFEIVILRNCAYGEKNKGKKLSHKLIIVLDFHGQLFCVS